MTTRHAPKPDADGLNRKLLRKVQAYIHAEESAWNQGSWAYHNGDHFPPEKDSCGTAYCFAGTAAVLAGQRLAWDKVFPDEPSFSYWVAANVLAPGATVPQWKAATKKLLAAALKLNDRPDDKEVDRQYWEATDALMNMRGESIKEVAVRLLGITDYDADVLFASGNSLEELDAMVETLSASGPGSL